MEQQHSSSTTQNKTVLIADDDPIHLSIVKAVMECSPLDLEILTADGGREATQVLENESVDLLVTDIDMPGTDGLQVLNHAVNRRLLIPAIAFTAGCSSQQRSEIMGCGAFRVLDKPLDLEDLLETTHRLLTSPAQAFPNGFALTSILQLVEIEKKSCDISVRSREGEQGDLIFVDGELVHARTESHIGDVAAREILAWPDSLAEIKETTLLHPTTVGGSLTQLLLESARFEDIGPTSQPGPSPVGPAPSPLRQHVVDSLFLKLAGLPGFVSASIVDLERYEALHSKTSPAIDLDPLQVDLQVSAACRIIEAERDLAQFEGTSAITDMVLRLNGSWHLLRSLDRTTALHLVLDVSVMAQTELSRWLAETCNTLSSARIPQ